MAFFPVVDVQGVSEPCYQVELILVQDGTLSILTLVPVSCSQRPDDTIPVVSSISLQADPSISYQEIGLIGRDADGDTLDYELLAPASDAGYTSAYIPSQTPKLYVTRATDFSGTIVLPYRATDGQHFSEPANVTIEIRENTDERGLGMQEPDPEVYSSFEVSRFSGDLFGAPGEAPTLPPSIDLSSNFPIPGYQGSQGSCVGWATAYALKSFQERVEEGWSLNTTEHLFSPAFIYNQINRGEDKGSDPGEA
ncbi:PKD domain containing protein, partial [Candidatus Thiomargarita nelsonii]